MRNFDEALWGQEADRGRVGRFWSALALTLLCHFFVLFFLWWQPSGFSRASETPFVPVEFLVDNFDSSPELSLEEKLAARMEEQVANLVSDANASVTSERRSSLTSQEEARMANEVEAELRALEQAEFERLASDKKDFGLAGVPDDGEHTVVNSLSEWDKQYDGRVIVSYDVMGRRHVRLPVPGYKCLESGTVVVTVDVASNGQVLKAEVVKSEAENEPACLEAAALSSALGSLFDPQVGKSQSGLISYRFVAQ